MLSSKVNIVTRSALVFSAGIPSRAFANFAKRSARCKSAAPDDRSGTTIHRSFMAAFDEYSSVGDRRDSQHDRHPSKEERSAEMDHLNTGHNDSAISGSVARRRSSNLSRNRARIVERMELITLAITSEASSRISVNASGGGPSYSYCLIAPIDRTTCSSARDSCTVGNAK